MTGESHNRYDDPFVRILELYVLQAIGALEKEDEQAMKKLTPDLQRIYGVGGGWRSIVEHVMEYRPGAGAEIRLMWLDRKQDVAEREGRRIRPAEFAREFADEVFRRADEDEEE
jgi:hypothetical protein